jgi:DNA-binding LacI/PurR family transcriptional regulator
MSVTLDDVAKKAGVSAKTVSRAVNGEKGISEATRERILSLVDEMNYVPHTQAQNLASGKTHSIALHYPLFSPKLISEGLEMSFVSGIGGEAAQANYYFTLFTGELDPRELTRICRASIADGMILMQVHIDDWRVETLRKLHFPFVMIGRCQDNHGLSFVDFDFENAVIDAYSHLVNLGHKEIGFLTYPVGWQQEGLGPAIRAHLGFQQAVRRFGLKPICYEASLTVESGFACASEAIEKHPDLTAFVVMHNTIAVGAINAIQSLEREIPDDYSVVGVALGRESELILPPLTAIPWYGDQIGQQAAKILINTLTNKNARPEQILLQHHLDARSSTARIRPNRG